MIRDTTCWEAPGIWEICTGCFEDPHYCRMATGDQAESDRILQILWDTSAEAFWESRKESREDLQL